MAAARLQEQQQNQESGFSAPLVRIVSARGVLVCAIELLRSAFPHRATCGLTRKEAHKSVIGQ
jgi:hypothetical protein